MRALRALFEIRLVREAAGYIAAASVAFVFDFSLYALLIALGVPYLVAAGTSFILGTAIHYWGATRYVFSFRRLSGTRSATVPFVSPRSQCKEVCALRITVSGPGQNRSMSVLA